jgi:hypothetical protein
VGLHLTLFEHEQAGVLHGGNQQVAFAPVPVQQFSETKFSAEEACIKPYVT